MSQFKNVLDAFSKPMHDSTIVNVLIHLIKSKCLSIDQGGVTYFLQNLYIAQKESAESNINFENILLDDEIVSKALYDPILIMKIASTHPKDFKSTWSSSSSKAVSKSAAKSAASSNEISES